MLCFQDSRFYSVSDGARKNYGEAMEGENEEHISDKRIVSDDEVSIEEEKENEQNNEGDESLGEYEDDFDSVDRNNKERDREEEDLEEDKEDKEELEDKEEQTEQQGRGQEKFGKGEEEQEEEEFENEGEEETNEEEQVKPHEDESEELKQEQIYETKVVHEDEKYKKENTAVPDEENEYFPHNRDEEEQVETEEHKELNKQEKQDKQEEEGKQEQQDEQDNQEEHDDEEEKYHMLINQTEGLESVQSTANIITESEKDEESMGHDKNKEASMHKTQLSKISNEDKQENEGVPLNEIKKNEDLTIQDEEDEENEGTPSNENQSREEMATTSEIAETQTQDKIVDNRITAQEKTLKTESVSNRSNENVDKGEDQNITNKHTSLRHAERFEDERKNSSKMLESPSYEEQEKEGNPEVLDVNNKNVTRTHEEKGDVYGSDMVERPTVEDISEYSRSEEEKINDRKGQEDEVTEDAPSTRTGQLDDNNGTESVTAERHLGENEINSTKKDEEGADAAIQDKESNDVNNLKEERANRTHEEDEAKSQSDSEVNMEEKDKGGETIERGPEMNEGVQLPTSHGGRESAVKINENGNMTEAINGEVEQDSFKDGNDENKKSTESTEQESPEIEKVSDKNEERKL